MEYLIVLDGVITNIIVCKDEEAASQLGALPFYDGATIGEPYSPPEPPAPEPTDTEVLNVLLGIL